MHRCYMTLVSLVGRRGHKSRVTLLLAASRVCHRLLPAPWDFVVVTHTSGRNCIRNLHFAYVSNYNESLWALLIEVEGAVATIINVSDPLLRADARRRRPLSP